jgi:PIN domain nuclease of toxin-antitoxin system
MNLSYLADTHILLWTFSKPDKISADIKSVLDDTGATVFYSPISLWEIAIKYGLGKLAVLGMSPEEFLAELENSFFTYRPLDPQTLISSYRLPSHHRDPFDRMLFWEAIRSDLVLLSADNRSDAYATSGLKIIH